MKLEHIFKVGGETFFCYETEGVVCCQKVTYPVCVERIYCGNLLITHKFILNLLNGRVTEIDFDVISVDQIRFNAVCIKKNNLTVYNQYGGIVRYHIDHTTTVLTGTKMELSHYSKIQGISVIILGMQYVLYGLSVLSVSIYTSLASTIADITKPLKAKISSLKLRNTSTPNRPKCESIIPRVICWETISQSLCKIGEFDVSDEMHDIAHIFLYAEISFIMPIILHDVEYNLYSRRRVKKEVIYKTYFLVRGDLIMDIFNVVNEEQDIIIYARDAFYVTNVIPCVDIIPFAVKSIFTLEVDGKNTRVCEIT